MIGKDEKTDDESTLELDFFDEETQDNEEENKVEAIAPKEEKKKKPKFRFGFLKEMGNTYYGRNNFSKYKTRRAMAGVRVLKGSKVNSDHWC